MNSHDWVATRKRLLKKIKAQVMNRLGAPSPSLKAYAKKFAFEFKGRWTAVSPNEFEKTLMKSEIIFGSDFHAHSQSQRAHVRLLRHLPEKAQVVLALECLAIEDQLFIDQFQNDELSEAQFLKQIDWARNWGFPWENYRPLFALAKRRKWRVVGLGRQKYREGSLSKRDGQMAADIQRLRQENLGLIYVLVGELHLASSHLPRLCERLMPNLRSIIIHQDVEELYFKLLERERDHQVEILRSGRRYCLMVSPPWVKWQSYLSFLEQTYDRELDEDQPQLDQTDHIENLIHLLARDFDLELDTSDLQVFTPESDRTLRSLKKNLPKATWSVLEYHLTGNRSFLIPKSGLVYLSSPTLNRAAGMAGEYIHAKLSKRQEIFWHRMDSFEPLIWKEAVAFFFSKWINPKRKPESMNTIKMQLSVLSPKDRGREAMALALEQRMSDVVWVREGRRRKRFKRSRNSIVIIEAARILGSILGEALFTKVRAGEIKPKELIDWMQFPLEDSDFIEFYLRLLKRL